MNNINPLENYGGAAQSNFTHVWQPYSTDLSINSQEFTQGRFFTVIPKSPAYVFGAKVLRPMIDIAFRVVSYVIDMLRAAFSSMDKALSNVFNFIPGANAKVITEKSKEFLRKMVSTKTWKKTNLEYHNLNSDNDKYQIARFHADRYPQVEQNPFKNKLKGIKRKGAKMQRRKVCCFPLRLCIFAPLR
jgi:hypothetical protein